MKCLSDFFSSGTLVLSTSKSELWASYLYILYVWFRICKGENDQFQYLQYICHWLQTQGIEGDLIYQTVGNSTSDFQTKRFSDNRIPQTSEKQARW